MKKDRSPGLVVGLLVAAFGGCSGDKSGPIDGADREVSDNHVFAESPAARAHLAELRKRFRWAVPQHGVDMPERARLRNLASVPSPVIGAGIVERFELVAGGRVRAVVGERARRGVAKPARVELPVRASDPVHLEDETSGMAIDFALEGARDVEIAVTGGMAMYEAALPGGADIVHRVSVEGTEDYVVFERKPERAELEYNMTPRNGVAEVRVVADTVEMLDAGGVPRLRVAPPYAVDVQGNRHAAQVEVTGCTVDRDSKSPAEKAAMAREGQCRVRVTWGELRYPVVVDPAWTTTGSMATPRSGHASSVLLDGKVLVAGGAAGASYITSAELYDPVAKTWSAVGNLAMGRTSPTASVLLDGTVLVVGGFYSNGYTNSAELYDPVAKTWATVGSLAKVRYSHTASVLSGGKVLVVGGAVGASELANAELYNPVTKTWSPADSLATGRRAHTASVLADGSVLVTGGYAGAGVVLASAELYDPATDAWSLAGNLAKAREQHAASVLLDGKVIVFGGDNNGVYLASAELYDPATKTWSATGSLATARYRDTASTLLNGKVLVTGGSNGSVPFASAELYDPVAKTWSAAGNLAAARYDHTANVLASGDVLIAGGANNGPALGSAEIFAQISNGACSNSGECVSGFCVDGFCCNAACAGACDVCAASLGAPSDGTCGPATVGYAGNPSCAPYFCDGVNAGCPCSSDLECGASDYCAATGTCSPRTGLGVTCDLAAGADCKVADCRKCISGNCADGFCCDTACAGSCNVCSAALGASINGTCSNAPAGYAGSPSCGDYVCSGANASCPSACASDTQCAQFAFCDPASTTCKTDQPVGIPCTSPTQCQSGFCADGICCNTACDGACDVCTQALGAVVDGTCATPAGYAGAPSCAPFVCDGINATCPLVCTSDAQCVGDRYCGSDGVCKPQKIKGALCNSAAGGDCWASGCAVCATGFCADGVCCTTACNGGSCDACSVTAGALSDGVCSLLTGPECDDGDGCTQTDTCQLGVCIGSNPIVCQPLDQCHEAGTCTPANGTCSNPTKQDGTSCTGGTCKSGTCTTTSATSSSSSTGGVGGSTSSTNTTSSGTGDDAPHGNYYSCTATRNRPSTPTTGLALLGTLLFLTGVRRTTSARSSYRKARPDA